jgi:hypothetical protein
VRFVGSPDELALIEKVGAKVGWPEHRRDSENGTLVLAPKPYSFEQFAQLIESVEQLGIKEISLQLIGPDGKPVGLDRNPTN